MEEKITTSDLRKRAEELIKSGKMPSLDEVMKVMSEAREGYVSKLKKFREKDKK
jgi:hypothetical protein